MQSFTALYLSVHNNSLAHINKPRSIVFHTEFVGVYGVGRYIVGHRKVPRVNSIDRVSGVDWDILVYAPVIPWDVKDTKD